MSRPVLMLSMLPHLPPGLLHASDWARLDQAVHLPTRQAFPDLLAPEAATLLEQAEIILGCWGTPLINAAVLARAPRLRMVAYAAASVRKFVTDALWARNIVVTSAVSEMAVPVAEFTLSVILLCGKDMFRFRDQHRSSRGVLGTDVWVSCGDARIGNHRKRIGIVGASHIGRLVIGHLRHFDVELQVYDPFLTEADASALGVQRSTLNDLMAWADIVSLHAPALPATRHMIGPEQLAAMRDGAWLINTARGWLVDHAALERELVSGRISAFIDTPLPDPLPPESPLYDLPNVVLTPHMAGAQGNELWRMSGLCVTEVERFVAGLPPLHPVTQADMARIA
jgi:phosphoglycerate dehydrogenase-like enzyme